MVYAAQIEVSVCNRKHSLRRRGTSYGMCESQLNVMRSNKAGRTLTTLVRCIAHMWISHSDISRIRLDAADQPLTCDTHAIRVAMLITMTIYIYICVSIYQSLYIYIDLNRYICIYSHGMRSGIVHLVEHGSRPWRPHRVYDVYD